jgi:hypothetical protein
LFFAFSCGDRSSALVDHMEVDTALHGNRNVVALEGIPCDGVVGEARYFLDKVVDPLMSIGALNDDLCRMNGGVA